MWAGFVTGGVTKVKPRRKWSPNNGESKVRERVNKLCVAGFKEWSHGGEPLAVSF